MKSYLLKISAALAVMVAVLILADTGNAQARRYNRTSKQQIQRLLKTIEERSDAFSNQLNKSLDRSRVDGGRTEDLIAERAADLENATDELRREFDRNDTRAENLPEARKVFNAAVAVNQIMNRRNFSRQAETSWVRLRTEINALAKIYGLRTIGNRRY